MKCCICGKEIDERLAHNLSGALNKKGEVINWPEDAYCCGECNQRYVIPGRLAQMYGVTKKQITRLMPDNLV